MSATLEPSWLETADFRRFLPDEPCLTFDFKSEMVSPQIDPGAKGMLNARWNARKPLGQASSTMGGPALAEEVIVQHAEGGGLTLVVVNTVRRAQALHEALTKQLACAAAPRLVLLHSRFRPPERKTKVNELLDPELNGDMT